MEENLTTIPIDEQRLILNDNVVPTFSADALCEATVQVVGPETWNTSDEYKVRASGSAATSLPSLCLASLTRK